MIAVVKSNCIEGLNEFNIMPYWYHTSHWRKQYPQGSNVGAGNITLSILRETHRRAKDYKLCPGISGPRKGGHPKTLIRLKSAMEVALENKKKQKGGGMAKGNGKKGNAKRTTTKQKEKQGGGMAKGKGKKGNTMVTSMKQKGNAKGNTSPPSTKMSEPMGKKVVDLRGKKLVPKKVSTTIVKKKVVASPKKVTVKTKKIG